MEKRRSRVSLLDFVIGDLVIEPLLLRSGVVEPVEVVDNGDQTHTVNYVPTREGPYSINVLYADEEIPRRFAQAQLHDRSFISSGSLSKKQTHPSSATTQPLQGQSASHPRCQQGAGQRTRTQHHWSARLPPRRVHHRCQRRRRGPAGGADHCECACCSARGRIGEMPH